jgi:hypothetical protein
VGNTRLARSQNFAHALQNLGMDVSLNVFPGVGHDITSDMRSQAMSFLERQAFAATIAAQNRAVAVSFIHTVAA